MGNIQKINTTLRKNSYLAAAGELLLGIVFVVMSFSSPASAYGQLNSRSIQMSDSAPSGTTITTGTGSGTNVVYKVSFTTSASTSIGAIVIDFCSNSALPGDPCTAPTGLNINYATLTVNNQTNLGSGAFSVVTSGSNAVSTSSRVVLSRATAAAPTAGSSFELGTTSAGITNPSGSPGTFYARIYTYASIPASSFSSTNIGTPIDMGGVALSTANVITITARVQEELIFCVSGPSTAGGTTNPLSTNCSGATTPAISLGHTISSGTQNVIDSAAVYSGNVFTQLSTNAGSGAVVRMHSSVPCGGLSKDGGTTCGIPPANSGASANPTAGPPSTLMSAGTAGFGLHITTPGTGVTVAAPYANTATNAYGMDTTTTGSNVTTAYGSQVYSTSAPVDNINTTWQFGVTAANTTPAGLYSTNIAVIATGQF